MPSPPCAAVPSVAAPCALRTFTRAFRARPAAHRGSRRARQRAPAVPPAAGPAQQRRRPSAGAGPGERGGGCSVTGRAERGRGGARFLRRVSAAAAAAAGLAGGRGGGGKDGVLRGELLGRQRRGPVTPRRGRNGQGAARGSRGPRCESSLGSYAIPGPGPGPCGGGLCPPRPLRRRWAAVSGVPAARSRARGPPALPVPPCSGSAADRRRDEGRGGVERNGMAWMVAVRRWAEGCADTALCAGVRRSQSARWPGVTWTAVVSVLYGEQHGLQQLHICFTQRQSRASALRAFVPVPRLRVPVRWCTESRLRETTCFPACFGRAIL